jgi:archaellum component FlaF (FlaF/FlaG flagellin family)
MSMSDILLWILFVSFLAFYGVVVSYFFRYKEHIEREKNRRMDEIRQNADIKL